MKLRLLPPGRPDQHLGLSHTLKHYLKPQEMWADICDQVAPEHRPRAVAEALPALDPPAWEQWETPPAELRAAWPLLEPAYEHGYAALILELADALPEPSRYVVCGTSGHPAQPWVVRDYRRACDAGRGVLLMVRWRGGGWQLYSAFRPKDFKLKRHECPPNDSASVSIRRKLAELDVSKRIAAWRGSEESK